MKGRLLIPALAGGVAVLLSGAILAVWVVPRFYAQPARATITLDEPAIPRGLSEPPGWLVETAPFDVVKHFELPPAEENAAPLYLDALYEFNSAMEGCFSADENSRRTPLVDKRNERIAPYLKNREFPLPRHRAAAVDAALREFDDGFEKVRQAQQRPQCLFVTGGDVAAVLPHALAIQTVSRVADLQIQRNLERGEVESAIELIEVIFRLSRDLQRRSATVCQLVCIAIENRMLTSAVKLVLASPNAGKEHCDHLLSIITRHRALRLDGALEAVRSEYVLQRLTLDQLDSAEGRRQLQISLSAKDDSLGEIWVAIYKAVSGDRSQLDVDSRRYDASLQHLDRDAEIAVFDDCYRSMVEIAGKPYAARHAAYREVGARMDIEGIYLARLLARPVALTMDIYVRHRAVISGTIGLVALRRWQLVHDEPPHDLTQVLADAGIDTVPEDPYCDGEIKLGVVNNEFVIYSVGPDGKDDEAQLEWNLERDQPGDYVFHMEP